MPTQHPSLTPTQRVTIASFDSYESAERAVDTLSDRYFPVEHVAIVGRDLRYVEQVTGRTTYLKAGLAGALNGAVVGLAIGWLLGLFDWADPAGSAFWMAVNGLWLGALLGALLGVLMHALTRGRRDFASASYTTADRYDVVVDDPGLADEARRVLAAAAAPAT
jgi:heat induced stress protein YflT